MIKRLTVFAIMLLSLVPVAYANPGVWVGTPAEPDTVWTGHIPADATRNRITTFAS